MTGGRCRVWDLPTRCFHWLLVSHFLIAYLTGDNDRWALYHITSGYVIAALLLFRIMWGMVGTRHARFSNFLPKPAMLLDYVKSFCQCRPIHFIGHNPLGAVGIVLLILTGILTTATGWAELSEWDVPYLELTHEWLANSMVALVAIHIAGVVTSSCMHRENLVIAMIHGCKSLSRMRSEETSSVLNHGLVAGFLCSVVISIWVLSFTDRIMGFFAVLSSLMLQSQ